MIEIKKSSIKNSGLGVFATEDISPRTVITEYAGRILNHLEINELNEEDQKYLLQFNNQYILGDKDSRDLKKCGQICNDAGRLLDFCKSSSSTTVSEVENYLDYCSKNINTYQSIDKNSCHLVASKKILKGDEIFFHYGYLYWSHHDQITLPKILQINLFHSYVGSSILTKSLTSDS